MPRRARPKKQPRAKTYIREWRKSKGLTLDKMSERLLVERELEVSDGQLSRIERGEQPYTQDLLEAIAYVLGTEPATLLMRDPAKPDLWTVFDGLEPAEQRQAMAVIEALRKSA